MFFDNEGNELGKGTFYNQFDYIVLPILIRTNFGNYVKFFINIGPYFGILEQGKYFGELNITGEQISGVMENLQKFDLGLTSGLGLSIPVGGHFSISLEARNNLELIPVHKAANGDRSANLNTTELLIGISYGFN